MVDRVGGPDVRINRMLKGWAPRLATAASLLAFALGGAAFGADTPAPAKTSGASKQPPAASQPPDYQVGPGDVLQLFVWKEPELSRDVTVRFDGKITVPLLGDIEAGGRSPEILAKDLEQRLTRFVGAPHVTLAVSQPNSARVYVMGQVLRPGVFPLTAPTTLVQALALAGGFKEFAKSDRIIVVRQEEREGFVTVNYKKLESATDLSQNILLRSGDTILVP
jgi:polysaccharide export outer membrane protein